METRQENGQDQAEHLRRKVLAQDATSEEITTSSLPPRSEVHKNKATPKAKWKIKYPVVRLLVIFFILLPIALLSIYYYYIDDKTTPAGTNGNESGVEQIELPIKSQNESSINGNTNSEPIAPEVNNLEKDKSEQIEQTVAEKEQSELELDESNSEKKQETSVRKTEYNVIYHTVKQEETLFSISMKYYQNKNGVEIIQQWNNLKDTNIYLGQTLKIPIKK